MSQKVNVMVFSGATYPAMQIIDCLKNNLRFHVISASSYPNHSEYVCDDVITDLPFINDADFVEKFKTVLVQKRVEYVFPTDETIAVVLKKHESEFPAVIVCSPYETTLLCRHKILMYQALQDKEYIPRIYNNSEINNIEDYPVFVKPDEGQGSKGSRLVNSFNEFDAIENLENMVISEYLPGEEYTVDCFTNRDRKLIFCNPRIRTRIMNGITARGNNIPCTDEFRTIIESLNSTVNFRGYWYVQLRRDRSGKLKLLEICTRFAGSFAISKGKGVNLPLLALCDFSGLETDVIENDYVVECDKTYIDRYSLKFDYSHVYIDYDDTITSKNGTAVNPYAIAYLYQCKTKNIRITLLTRHSASLEDSLFDSMKRLKLNPELFDDIIELEWKEPKYKFITDVNESIFIDNSFAERREVKNKLNMKVFDVCNIDSLFDWRF